MKVKKKLTLVLALGVNILFSQEAATESLSNDSLTKLVRKFDDQLIKLNRLNISGYLQPQFQIADSAGAHSFAGGNFAPNSNSRYMMRRGRIKFTYTHNNAMYMLNTDWTEKGVNIRETYVRVTDPWTKWVSLTTGLIQVRFSHDLTYSSSSRETPERARMFQILFPTERDLQSFVTVQAPKSSKLHMFKGDFAIMNGAGVGPEFDSHKDFSGRVSLSNASKSGKITYGMGVSYLSGAWGQNRGLGASFNKKAIYTTTANSNGSGDVGFAPSFADTANKYALVKREYIGFDAQLSIDWAPGITTLRAEYIQGQQPGTSSSSTSMGAAPLSELYVRQFNGASLYFVQNIVNSKHQLVFKYDWFDPNTKVNGNQIGKAGTNTKTGDIKYTTIGFGWNYSIAKNTKMTFYYDIVTNEKTQLSGYSKDVKDNVFTVRMQYVFGR